VAEVAVEGLVAGDLRETGILFVKPPEVIAKALGVILDELKKLLKTNKKTMESTKVFLFLRDKDSIGFVLVNNKF